jgi:signal transduction histidine kinase
MMTMLALVASLFAFSAVRAADYSTPEQAKEMAIRAAEFLRTHGPEKAYAAFNDASDTRFHDRDLYVFVYDLTGKALARGNNPALIGKNLIDLKDVDGKAFVRDFVAVTDAAWVDYKWQNPETNKVEAKTSYIIRVGDVVVGVGAYKN